MAHCPKCGVENAEGAGLCAQCGATLPPPSPPVAVASQKPDPELEPESRETACVRVFRGPLAQMEADLARTVLEQEGILCVLPGEVMAEVLPGVDVVQLWVRQEDADEAKEIIEGFFDSAQPLEPDEDSS